MKLNTTRQRVDVLLVSMPFGPLLEPSLGLSLLKATLARHGCNARVLYLTLPFAKDVGIDVRRAPGHLCGDPLRGRIVVQGSGPARTGDASGPRDRLPPHQRPGQGPPLEGLWRI
jgi:hypothetical protein